MPTPTISSISLHHTHGPNTETSHTSSPKFGIVLHKSFQISFPPAFNSLPQHHLTYIPPSTSNPCSTPRITHRNLSPNMHSPSSSPSPSQPPQERVFQCHHLDCLRKFARKTSLTNHLKAHLNSRSRSISRSRRGRRRPPIAKETANKTSNTHPVATITADVAAAVTSTSVANATNVSGTTSTKPPTTQQQHTSLTTDSSPLSTSSSPSAPIPSSTPLPPSFVNPVTNSVNSAPAVLQDCQSQQDARQSPKLTINSPHSLSTSVDPDALFLSTEIGLPLLSSDNFDDPYSPAFLTSIPLTSATLSDPNPSMQQDGLATTSPRHSSDPLSNDKAHENLGYDFL